MQCDFSLATGVPLSPGRLRAPCTHRLTCDTTSQRERNAGKRVQTAVDRAVSGGKGKDWSEGQRLYADRVGRGTMLMRGLEPAIHRRHCGTRTIYRITESGVGRSLLRVRSRASARQKQTEQSPCTVPPVSFLTESIPRWHAGIKSSGSADRLCLITAAGEGMHERGRSRPVWFL